MSTSSDDRSVLHESFRHDPYNTTGKQFQQVLSPPSSQHLEPITSCDESSDCDFTDLPISPCTNLRGLPTPTRRSTTVHPFSPPPLPADPPSNNTFVEDIDELVMLLPTHIGSLCKARGGIGSIPIVTLKEKLLEFNPALYRRVVENPRTCSGNLHKFLAKYCPKLLTVDYTAEQLLEIDPTGIFGDIHESRVSADSPLEYIFARDRSACNTSLTRLRELISHHIIVHLTASELSIKEIVCRLCSKFNVISGPSSIPHPLSRKKLPKFILKVAQDQLSVAQDQLSLVIAAGTNVLAVIAP